MIAYLTIGDKSSGIFSGQVVDVCNLLSELTKKKVRLISFISIREYRVEKKKIKQVYPYSTVLPMFPRLKNWKWNIVLLFIATLFKKYNTIICRNSIPANLGLMLKKVSKIDRVVLDGRGAEYEQYVEYKMLSDVNLEQKLFQVEKQAVLKVDYRIAVSEELVKYWKKTFNYQSNKHVVIPCTLNRRHENFVLDKINRKVLGFNDDDVVLVYCGSVSGWQSFDKMFAFVKQQFDSDPKVKLLLLTKKIGLIEELMNVYPNRIICNWCSEEDVMSMMSIGDYGLIIREDTITNKVASPVKFAEYLFAGLSVIISERIGDYNSFLKENNCGVTYSDVSGKLRKLAEKEKNSNRELAKIYFSKNGNIIKEKYQKLLKKRE